MPKKTNSRAKLDFQWGGLSDKGKVRDGNEDRWVVDEKLGLFIVSDGMGGHPAGEVAAELVVERLPGKIAQGLEQLGQDDDKAVLKMLKEKIIELNDELVEEAANGNGSTGMGTTLAMAMLDEGRVYVANAGDSRIYILRGGQMEMVSQEHSAAAETLGQQWASIPVEMIDPGLAGITRYIGMDTEPLRPYAAVEKFQAADRLLLCSDGLTDMVGEELIEQILSGGDNCRTTAQKLVDEANQAGGADNITVIVTEV